MTAVELETSGDLTVSIGEMIALSVTAGEDVIDRLTFTVNDGTLHLGVEGEPLVFGSELRMRVRFPSSAPQRST